MSILRLFILCEALLTLFVAGGLYFKDNSIKNRSIGVFTLLFGVEILYFLVCTSKILPLYPDLYGRYYFSAGLLYGPLLYIHFKSIVREDYVFGTKDLWHLLPMVLFNISFFDTIIMSSTDRVEYFTTADSFYSRILTLNYLRALHQIIYGIAISRFFLSKEYTVPVNSKFYLGGMTIIYVIITVVISFLTMFANGWRDFSLYYLISLSIVFLIGYMLYADPDFLQKVKRKYAHSSVSRKELTEIKNRLTSLFAETKPYLERKLSIDDLAAALDTKPHYLSQTFTTELKESFSDFVNRHRIEHSKELLRDDRYQHLKIEAIAEKSGFNNKVTFYKAFSKFEETTPSKYRKAHEML